MIAIARHHQNALQNVETESGLKKKNAMTETRQIIKDVMKIVLGSLKAGTVLTFWMRKVNAKNAETSWGKAPRSATWTLQAVRTARWLPAGPAARPSVSRPAETGCSWGRNAVTLDPGRKAVWQTVRGRPRTSRAPRPRPLSAPFQRLMCRRFRQLNRMNRPHKQPKQFPQLSQHSHFPYS